MQRNTQIVRYRSKNPILLVEVSADMGRTVFFSFDILIGQGVLNSVNDFLGGENIIENSSKGGGNRCSL